MTKSKIQNIKSITKLQNDFKTISAIKTVMPVLRPILKLFKTDVSKIDEALSRIKEMESQLTRLAMIPDKFNDIFGCNGWIMYEMLDLDVAEKAISLSEIEGVDVAEQELVNHYTPERVKWKLLTMYSVLAFHSRMELANKALIDYEEERYHACVPVVLALLDGMVNEIHGKQKGLRRGFSSEDADLEAWDSIAAHSKGLNELKHIFNTGRYSTVTDKITIPYRNGILHGMDLGYDNKTVAAKSWAALFAAREWAIKAEHGLLEEQPEKPQKSWKEVFRDIDELNQVKKYQNEWIPRDCISEENLIISEGHEFVAGTPEHTFAEFLILWKKRNYGKMGEHLSRYMNGTELKTFPAQIRALYLNKQFSSFIIERVVETAPSITLISGFISYIENGTVTSKANTIRIIAETQEGDMALRITNDTIWRIMDMNILQERMTVQLPPK